MLSTRNSNDPEATRLSIVGTRAAGKSTCIGLLNLTAIDLKNDNDKDTTAQGLYLKDSLIIELNSTIREVVGNLNRGIFPPPTASNNTFNSCLVLEFERRRRIGRANSYRAELNITDVAGETIAALMSNFARGDFHTEDTDEVEEINKFILRANSFVLIVDTEELVNAALPNSARNDMPDSDGLQDVELSRFVDSLLRYKRNNPHSPPIRSVALIGTKYDRVRTRLSGMLNEYGDLENDQASKNRFMSNFLPQTWQGLSNLVDDKRNLEIFYSSVVMARNIDDEEPRIARVEGRLRPDYSFDEYKRLINWIGERAG